MGLAAVQVGSGMVPLILAGNRSHYLSAETFLATVALTGAVAFSFVYALSISTVARYQRRWRNVFNGSLLLNAAIAIIVFSLLQIPQVAALVPGVSTWHVAAAALLCLRNVVSPILMTLNLMRQALWCELLSLLLFGAGLLLLPRVMDIEPALLVASGLQTLPHLMVAARFSVRRGHFAQPLISISDGISGVLDALFGSLSTNGARLALLHSPLGDRVMPLVLFRIGTGLAQAGAQIFFLFFGRRVIREVCGGSGRFYFLIVAAIAALSAINVAAAVWAASAIAGSVLVASYALGLSFAGVLLYHARFSLYGLRRVSVFLMLCLLLYGGLKAGFEAFVPLWAGANFAGACLVLLVYQARKRGRSASMASVEPPLSSQA